jgi:phosphopantothenoylcysteine decarboxylase / phosphopantothenate---cysteine ligase
VKFVVTAGPTREPLDPVRFLSNRSSGKMGYAMAEAAAAAGHDVLLISGPVCLTAPDNVHREVVETGDEMFAAVKRAVRGCDVLVMCAAVADYKPARAARHKIKKTGRPVSLVLRPTRDILAAIAQGPRSFLVVGFAAETENVSANAQKKLRTKKCDLIVANDVSARDCGMESDVNELTIFFPNKQRQRIPRAKKRVLARSLLKIIVKVCEKRLTKKT